MGIPFTQWYETLSRYTRDSRLSCGENPKSLSHLVLECYRDVTLRQTEDRITIANMLALARKNTDKNTSTFLW